MPLPIKLAEPLISNKVLNNVGGDELRGKQYLAPDFVEMVESEPCIRVLRAAHDRLREGHYATIEALRVSDPTLTPEAHFLEVKKQADKLIEQCGTYCTDAERTAKKQLEALDNKINGHLQIHDSSRANEIRGYFLKLKKNERLNAAHMAIERDDKETLGAVLSAPSYLSGLTDDDKAMLMTAYAEKAAPDLVKRKRVIQRAITINDVSFNQALIAHGVLFPEEKVKEIVNRRNVAAEARGRILAS